MKKKKIIVSSLMTIALSAILAVGGTFALFTSEQPVNITVASGKVEIKAEVAEQKFETWVELENKNGTLVKNEKIDSGFGAEFDNKGVADYQNGAITLTNVTPGDVLKFAIDVENTSTVSVQYRVELSTADTTNKLWNALEITIDDVVKKESGSIAEWKSTWSAFDSTNKATVNVKVELPSYIGNDLQTTGADLTVKVYAVQSNGTELV